MEEQQEYEPRERKEKERKLWAYEQEERREEEAQQRREMQVAARRQSVRDMTEGQPMTLILGFAIPMLLGILFQQFYSMADTVIVGRYLGVNALAGVGSTGAINFMVNGFVIGMCSGFAIPVSQRFGAHDYADMRKFVANIVWLTLIFAAAVTVLVVLLTKQVLVWTSTPKEIFDYAYQYILIVFIGIPATYLYNITASIIRALGDAKTPVVFLVFTSILNIALDFLSIVGLGMGVQGPAIATVVSQALSGAFCLLYMKKKYPLLHFQDGERALDAGKCRVLLSMAIPMGLQYSITAIGSVILQGAVNTLGAIAVASVTAGQKISMFCCCVFDALGATMATYAGQNVGAGKLDRIQEGVYAATKLGSIYAVAACAVLIVGGGEIPLLFIDASEKEVIGNAHLFLIANSLFYIPLVIVNVWRFTIQGMGYSVFAVLAGVCEMVARALIGFVGIPLFGFPAACLASPLAWILADAFLIPGFYHCMRQMNALFIKRS